MVCLAMAQSPRRSRPSREGFAMLPPGVLRVGVDQAQLLIEWQVRSEAQHLAQCWIAVGAGELAFAGDGDAAREDEEGDLDRKLRLAGALAALELVLQLEIELERSGDDAEHVDAPAQPEVAGERGGVLLHAEIEARHHMDAARRDTQIDGHARAEFERSLQELDSMRIDGDAER